MQRDAQTGGLLFYRPDGSWINPQPVWIQAETDVAQSSEESWHWNGDSMDYGAALYAIDDLNRRALHEKFDQPIEPCA